MNNKGFIGFIAVMLAIAIVCFLGARLYTNYFNKPTGMDHQTKQVVEESGIDTTNQRSVVGSLKSQIKTAQDTQVDQAQQVLNDGQ